VLDQLARRKEIVDVRTTVVYEQVPGDGLAWTCPT